MTYLASVNWRRNDTPFNPKSFNRNHNIRFGGGFSVEASSAPEYLGNRELPNPEELFTAALASCFMLTFLFWAANKGIMIDEYQAEAEGTLAKNSEGKLAMTEVVIKPKIIFHDNKQPEAAILEDLFKKAHDNCFISSSVKTTVKIIYPA